MVETELPRAYVVSQLNQGATLSHKNLVGGLERGLRSLEYSLLLQWTGARLPKRQAPGSVRDLVSKTNVKAYIMVRVTVALMKHQITTEQVGEKSVYCAYTSTL